MSELVSIIVPVYRVEEYLNRCVDSIIGQTYTNLEIILVDDGSPDKCPEICDQYALKDSRIRVIHQKNGGQAVARNVGVQNAKGKLIAFVDSDDYVSPVYIEQLYKTLADSGKKIASCGHVYYEKELNDEVTDHFSVYLAKEAISRLINEDDIIPAPWEKLFVKDVLVNAPFPEHMIYEDYAAAPLLLHLADGIAYSGNKLYYYTTNKNGTTKSLFDHKQMDYYRASGIVKSFLQNTYPELLHSAAMREIDTSVSFFRKMSRDKYRDQEDLTITADIIKNGLKEYLDSSYPVQKKAAAILIAVAPSIARLLL